MIFRILTVTLQESVHSIISFLYQQKDPDFSDYRNYSFGYQ